MAQRTSPDFAPAAEVLKSSRDDMAGAEQIPKAAVSQRRNGCQRQHGEFQPFPWAVITTTPAAIIATKSSIPLDMWENVK